MGREFRYTCDYAPCNNSEPVPETDKEMPDGWITLMVHVKGGKNSALLLCSNKCVLAVARERKALEATTRSGHSPETKAEVLAFIKDGIDLGATKAGVVQQAASRFEVSKPTIYGWLRGASDAAA